MFPKEIKEQHSSIFIDQCLTPPSPEKLPPAGGGNKYRDQQLENMQKVRGLGTLCSKWDVSIKAFPEGTGGIGKSWWE